VLSDVPLFFLMLLEVAGQSFMAAAGGQGQIERERERDREADRQAGGQAVGERVRERSTAKARARERETYRESREKKNQKERERVLSACASRVLHSVWACAGLARQGHSDITCAPCGDMWSSVSPTFIFVAVVRPYVSWTSYFLRVHACAVLGCQRVVPWH